MEDKFLRKQEKLQRKQEISSRIKKPALRAGFP